VTSSEHKPNVCLFHRAAFVAQSLMGEEPPKVGGGAETRVLQVARILAQRGWPVVHVCMDYGQPRQMWSDDGIRIIGADRLRTGLAGLGLLLHRLPRVVRAFHAAKADVYVMFGMEWCTGLVATLCRLHRRRLVLWLASDMDLQVHDPAKSQVRGRFMRWLTCRAIPLADVILTQTQRQQALMRQLHHRDCSVVPNIWPFTGGDLPKANPPEVLWAGRYIPLKRPEWVVELARRLPGIIFRMAGGAPTPADEARFEEIKAAAADLPNVEILGSVPFPQMDPLYARASAVLCTSTIEGFPNTFLQAWQHKTPVVSTFDPDGILERESVGVACQTLDDLVSGLERVCADEGVAMGERGRAYLERVHSVEAVMAALEPLLLDLAG
jgi:glycosyltransferase involved in cell wall biosynthesis